MKRENIDDDVWKFVAEKFGRFGDRWCDALRRGLEIPTPRKSSISRKVEPKPTGRNKFAERRLDRRLTANEVAFRFGDDPWKSWKLPASKDNREEIRRIREEAQDFGRANGATAGQLNAIAKAFSDGGYYLSGPRLQTGASSV